MKNQNDLQRHLHSALFVALSFVLSIGGLTGCVSHRKSNDVQAAKVARLETRLRRAKARIESLREHNLVLKKKIKVVRENGGEDPEISPEKLAAFKSGLELDVPISPTGSQREDVALTRPSRKVGGRRSVLSISEAPRVRSESADQVLARTVVELLKSGEEDEADRTALLLAKSYPDSNLVAETRFQQGLYYFRKGNLRQADRLFQASLTSPLVHIRVRAGASLMRGVIAGRMANVELSRKILESVRTQYPGSPESLRATRELKALQAIAARAENSARTK